MPREIWTIGHSTRTLLELVRLLQAASIELVADVRRFPASRRLPHFNEQALAAGLAEEGIGYVHIGALGGRRGKREPGSPNTGWRVDAFNAYADYMNTPEFAEALELLEKEALTKRAAMMCSEAVPWRCHRRLIADALTVRGWTVRDIMSATKVEPHRLTDFARVEGERITYPAAPLFEGGT